MSPKAHRVKPSNVKSKSRKQKLIVIGIFVAIAVVIAAYVVFSQNTPATSPSPSPSASTSPSASASTSPSPSTSPLTEEELFNGTKVRLETSMGDIVIQLRTDKPITTSNFLNLIQHGVYDSTIFHRVIAGFMIQGGANSSATISTISDEIGSNNHNYNGTIAMAKTSLPNSATSQFFINVDNNNDIVYQDGSTFDGTYTVFGRIIEGMDVVMTISNVATTGSSSDVPNMPLQDVTIIKAEVLA